MRSTLWVFLFGVGLPLRSNGTLAEPPWGRMGRQAASTERRTQRGRSPGAADCQVGGAHVHDGRHAAPDFDVARSAMPGFVRVPGSRPLYGPD
jgi:hypothetical protein